MSGPLRIAFLCRNTTLPRWQMKAMRQALEIPGVTLAGFGLQRDVHLEEPRKGLFGYLDRRILGYLSRAALVPEDIQDLVNGTTVIEFADGVPSEGDLVQLASLNADLIISFLPGIAPSSGPNKLPLWQFLLNGRSITKSGSIPLSADLLERPSALAVLVGPSGSAGCQMELALKRTDGSTTVDMLLLGASWLPCQLMQELREKRHPTIHSSSINVSSSSDKEENIVSTVRLFVRLEMQRLRLDRNTTMPAENWNIGILYQPLAALLEPAPSMNVRWLASPSNGNQRMEPFGYIAPDGQLNVLYRRKDQNKQFDSIARLRPKSDSVLKRSRTMLSAQGDLEYPFVLEQPDGAYAVIGYPHQRRTELFKIASTNDGLDHVKILLDRALTSPTLTEHEGRWWLFGTAPEAPDNVLLAFYSDRFDGTYLPHAQNPLKVDRSNTRPAGTFFRNGNELWRPALDASSPDTKAVILNRIEVLTPDRFEELPGNRISGFKGTAYAHGVRTLAAMGDITLIDGMRSTVLAKPAPKKKGKGKRQRRSSEDE